MNQMITKASTPFQFASMFSLKDSKIIQRYYHKELYKISNLSLSQFAPEWAAIQRILSLRDASYYNPVANVSKIGNTIGNWKKMLKKINSSLDNELSWYYELTDSLPWDNINHKLSRALLIKAFKQYCRKYVGSELC